MARATTTIARAAASASESPSSARKGWSSTACCSPWGNDLVWEEGAGAAGASGAWSNARAKRHARSAHVRDPFQLGVNAYRVLLTKGRDGAVLFVPPLAELNATAARLQGHGVKIL